MLSKIPANVKPVIAIVGLVLAAVIFWLVLSGGQKAVLDPVVIDMGNGNIFTVSHDRYRREVARSGNNRRIFPLESNGAGGLRVHNRYRADFVNLLETYGISRDQASQYLDFSNESWPQVRTELVPGWARNLSAPSSAQGDAPSAESGGGRDR